jgi:pimeloyl-ACP methyl ester carboxylesterase
MFEKMGALFGAGVEKMILPGTGHFLHLERPREVNAKIVQFLKS